MTIEFYIGKMGCGMGPCAIIEPYLRDRQCVVDHVEELPEKCKECIRLNEEEKKNEG